MTLVAAGTGALEATQQQVLTQLQTGSTGSVTVNDPTITTQKMTVNNDGSINTNATSYGYNSGGPGGGTSDRARLVQGKASTSLTISSASTGQPTVTLSSSAPSTLLPGMQVLLTGGTQESAYVNAVAGTSVTLSSNIVNASHTALVYDVFATKGPGASAVSPIGVPVNLPMGYDATSQQYYLNQMDSSGYQRVTTQTNIMGWIRAGQGYVASTGSKTASATVAEALSLFNTHSSGKTLLLYRIQAQYGVTAGSHPVLTVTSQTSDPGPGWTSGATVTPTNASLGGAASVASVYQTAVASGATIAGTTLFAHDLGSSAPQDLLTQGQVFVLNDTTGITVYLNAVNTTVYAINFFWIEI